MNERSRIVWRMAEAIALELGEEGALHPPYDPTCPHLPYLQAADKALQTLEEQLPTDAEEILPCTCGHNGYGAHMVGCELYVHPTRNTGKVTRGG
jgi:hypothetical protein